MREITASLPSRVSRRAFIAGAAASAAMSSRVLARCIARERRTGCAARGYSLITERACAHLRADSRGLRASRKHRHRFVRSFCRPSCYSRCSMSRETASQWENLPRGVIETYAVQRGMSPATASLADAYGALCDRSAINRCCVLRPASARFCFYGRRVEHLFP